MIYKAPKSQKESGRIVLDFGSRFGHDRSHWLWFPSYCRV